MKQEWLKALIGESYTEELDEKVSQEIGKHFVARSDFNDKNSKVKELETQVSQLNGEIRNRDTQLEDLRKTAGDNQALQQQIDTLTQQNKDAKAAYEKDLAAVRFDAAVEAEMTAAGSRNNVALKAVLAEFLKDGKVVDGKVTGKENGEAVTLVAKMETMKKSADSGYMFHSTKFSGWKPGEGGDGGKPGADKKPSEMSYAELSAYLAENPDAKLD